MPKPDCQLLSPIACHAKVRCYLNMYVTPRQGDVIGDIAATYSESTRWEKRRVVKINNDRRGRSLHRGTARTKMYACVEQKICECTRTIGLWHVKTSGFWADYQMLWYHCTLESHRTLESSIYKIFVSTC